MIIHGGVDNIMRFVIVTVIVRSLCACSACTYIICITYQREGRVRYRRVRCTIVHEGRGSGEYDSACDRRRDGQVALRVQRPHLCNMHHIG